MLWLNACPFCGIHFKQLNLFEPSLRNSGVLPTNFSSFSTPYFYILVKSGNIRLYSFALIIINIEEYYACSREKQLANIYGPKKGYFLLVKKLNVP